MLKEELLQRIKRLQNIMEMHSLDSYIITAEEDIWYFTNITYKPEERPFFLIISLHQQPVLVVPKLEEMHVYKGILDCKVITYWEYPSPSGENWYDELNDSIKDFQRTGIEDNLILPQLKQWGSKVHLPSPDRQPQRMYTLGI